MVGNEKGVNEGSGLTFVSGADEEGDDRSGRILERDLVDVILLLHGKHNCRNPV